MATQPRPPLAASPAGNLRQRQAAQPRERIHRRPALRPAAAAHAAVLVGLLSLQGGSGSAPVQLPPGTPCSGRLFALFPTQFPNPLLASYPCIHGCCGEAAPGAIEQSADAGYSAQIRLCCDSCASRNAVCRHLFQNIRHAVRVRYWYASTYTVHAYVYQCAISRFPLYLGISVVFGTVCCLIPKSVSKKNDGKLRLTSVRKPGQTTHMVERIPSTGHVSPWNLRVLHIPLVAQWHNGEDWAWTATI